MVGYQNGVGTALSFNLTDGANSSQVKLTNGNPEGVITATVGSLALDYASGFLYRKQSGAGNTGWVLPDGGQGWIPGLACAFKNLSFTLATGTLTIAGRDDDLSASNPAYVAMRSNANSGESVLYTLTSNITLDENDLDGNIFNRTSGVAYADSFPLYIGFMADANDENLVGVVTALPHISISPSSSANIGDPSAANADLGYSAFSMSDIVEADYTDKYIGLIGSVTATTDSSDEYTIDALDTDYDGISRFQQSRQFTHGVGLFGAGTGSPISDNTTGTAPTFNTNYVDYTIGLDGFVDYNCEFAGDGGTAGSGAISAMFMLPFIPKTADSADRITVGHGWGTNQSLGNMQAQIVVFPGTNARGALFVYNGTNNTLLSQYSAGGRRWNHHLRYLADDGR